MFSYKSNCENHKWKDKATRYQYKNIKQLSIFQYLPKS